MENANRKGKNLTMNVQSFSGSNYTSAKNATRQRTETMFENYDRMFTRAQKEVENNVFDEYKPLTDKPYTEKQLNNFIKRVMLAFETLDEKEKEQYVDAAIKFLADA